jgi:hypothetical protein
MNARTGQGRPEKIRPVRVMMRRSENPDSPWGIPRWELLAVLPDTDPPQHRERRLVHKAEGQHDFEWSGLRVVLFRDAAESYWYNLVGRDPSLCVICRPGEDIDLEPFTVTANYDEAGAHMEADDTVFSAPLPAELVTELEEFVMTHYRPVEPHKRKRRNWAAEAEDGQRRK